MMNLIMPLKTGELSYIYLIKKRGINTTEGVATLFIARVMDLITLLTIFFVLFAFFEEMRILESKVLKIAIIVFISAIVLLIGIVLYGVKIAKKSHSQSWLAKGIRKTIGNFQILKTKKVLFRAIVSSLVLAGVLFTFYYAVFNAMNIQLGLQSLIIGVMIYTILISLPVQGIGGFGSMEATWALAFVISGLSKEQAVLSGFGQHLIIILYFLTWGVYGLIKVKNIKKLNE